MFAKTIMDTNFHFLHPRQSITHAVQSFKSAGKAENKKIFGMMVTDNEDRLVGMLSMYDILLYIRPKHIRILGEMEDIEHDQIFESMSNRVRNIRVEDLMSTELVTIRPDTHLLLAMDIMVQKHIRRLPVVEAGKLIGIVYRSDLFNHIMEILLRNQREEKSKDAHL